MEVRLNMGKYERVEEDLSTEGNKWGQGTVEIEREHNAQQK